MISVVIPSYNRRDGMLALLADLHRQEGVEFEVIVVDDCSPDDSVEAIRSAFPTVRLAKNETNLGPSVTRNRGILTSDCQIHDSSLGLSPALKQLQPSTGWRCEFASQMEQAMTSPDGGIPIQSARMLIAHF
jgi:glycosyltransferase involved in cell wall biosynthesis